MNRQRFRVQIALPGRPARTSTVIVWADSERDAGARVVKQFFLDTGWPRNSGWDPKAQVTPL